MGRARGGDHFFPTNIQINKLLPKCHGLISALTEAGNDHDLLEFWLRHIQAYGTDRDAMSYKIYGYKITWSSILNVSRPSLGG